MRQVLGINLYRFEEVASLLGVHPSSITRYVKEGRLHATMIGRTKFISEQEIKNLILGKGTQAEPQPNQA